MIILHPVFRASLGAVILMLAFFTSTASSHPLFEIYREGCCLGAVEVRFPEKKQVDGLTPVLTEYEYSLNCNPDELTDFFKHDLHPHPEFQATILIKTNYQNPDAPSIQIEKKIKDESSASFYSQPVISLFPSKYVRVDPMLEAALNLELTPFKQYHLMAIGTEENSLFRVNRSTSPTMMSIFSVPDQQFLMLHLTAEYNTSLQKPHALTSLTARYKSKGKNCILEYRRAEIENIETWRKQNQSVKQNTHNVNPFVTHSQATEPDEPGEAMEWQDTATAPILSEAKEGYLSKASGVRTVDDMVAPDNYRFTQDLQDHGDQIYEELETAVNQKPKDCTCPMPGMQKLILEIDRFLNNTILSQNNDNLSQSDKAIYRQLLRDLQQLKKDRCPWNRAFVLTYKASHLISFFNKDKAAHYRPPAAGNNNHKKGHRSHYEDVATLQSLNALPWNDALNDPGNFREKLKPLWFSFHLEGHRYCKKHNPLDHIRFMFPCSDKLNLPFFNRTWMLGIHPLGCFTDPEIEFDGAYGLWADFFEHDMLHSAGSLRRSGLIKEYLLMRNLLDHIDNTTQIKRRYSAGQLQPLEVGQIDFPKEALHLFLLEMDHEQNQAYGMHYVVFKGFNVAHKAFANGELESRYDNLKTQTVYNKMNQHHVEQAAIFLHCLKQQAFWEMFEPSKEKSLEYISRAQQQYNEFDTSSVYSRSMLLSTLTYVYGDAYSIPNLLHSFIKDTPSIFLGDISIDSLKTLPDQSGHILPINSIYYFSNETLALAAYLLASMQHTPSTSNSLDDHMLIFEGGLKKIKNRFRFIYENSEDMIKRLESEEPQIEQAAAFIYCLEKSNVYSIRNDPDFKSSIKSCFEVAMEYYRNYLLSEGYTIETVSVDKSMHWLPSRAYGNGHQPRLIRIEKNQAVLLPVPIDPDDWELFPTEKPAATVFRTGKEIHVFDHHNKHRILRDVSKHRREGAILLAWIGESPTPKSICLSTVEIN